MAARVVAENAVIRGASGATMAAHGRRLHLQHGPIDLIIAAWGTSDAVQAAYRVAWARFDGLLPELTEELAALRRPVTSASSLAGPVARRMLAACKPHAAQFITPIAAVAGAVADEVLAAMSAAAPLDRAFVNNGGDIAFHVAPAQSMTMGIVSVAGGHGHPQAFDGTVVLHSNQPVRGIATSGWRGRSLSLGIADSVTVLGRDAAAADAAATMIANAVDVEHAGIRRVPANERVDDTDLGDRLTTVAVANLPIKVVNAALDHGARHASRLIAADLIWGVAISLQGRWRTLGGLL